MIDILNIQAKDLVTYQTLAREYIAYLTEEIRKYTNINGQKTFPNSVFYLKDYSFLNKKLHY